MTKYLENITALLILTMTAAIFTQVLTRYVLHISLPFLIMVISFCMSWLTMLGAALAIESGKHFAIDIFADKEKVGYVKFLQIVKNLIILIVIVSLIIGGWEFALIGLQKEDPSTGLSEVYTYSSVFGGAAFMLFYFVKTIIRRK